LIHTPAASPASLISLLHQAQATVGVRTVVWSELVATGGNLAINLTVAAIILVATFWAAGWVSKLTRRAFGRIQRHHRPDAMLQAFAASLARYIVLIVGLIAVLQRLGIQTTSILAVLGAASLAIGLALQGALSNVAGGVLILLFRPFRVGDRVCISGKEGVVRALDVLTTELADPDNVRVIVPNGKVFGDVIVNYTRHENRRIQIHFGIDFQDDVDLALKLLTQTAAADPRVLKTPAPWSRMTQIGDNGPVVTLRAWMAPDDYWSGRFDLVKAVWDAFRAAGLHFPYSHQTGLSREEQMAIPGGRGEVAPPAPDPSPPPDQTGDKDERSFG
jgi:small conductance mechanosensitive channel